MSFINRMYRPCWMLMVLLIVSGCEPNVATNNSSGKSGASTADSKSSGGVGLKRLIILTNGDSPYWDACRAGLEAANTELILKDSGLVASLEVNDGTAQGQLAKLQQYGTQSDIAGVGVSALDANNVAIADELRSLQKKGIKILTIDSDVERSQFRDARFAFIGTDNHVGGTVLGTCAKGLKPTGGEYVTFVGYTGAQNAKDRIAGFETGAGSAFINKDSMADDVKKDKARENVRNAMSNHPKLSVLVGIYSYNAPAIVDVVKESNRRKDFLVVAFDAEPTAITGMAEGNIDALVLQNPFQMGYQGVRLLAALANDKKEVIAEMFPNLGKPDGDIFDTGLRVVVPNVSSPLKADLFDKSVEVMPLDRLQEWLKKYDLTGS